MDLLERDAAFLELNAALSDTHRGEGRVVLVSGEAGIGKTALVERFTNVQRASRVLWGSCDALFTPRPLGPLHDIATQTQGTLPALLTDAANRTAVFSETLAELQRSPTIAVFEDLHWADEATLDLLLFLGRRITRTTALLVLTYRDDELGPGHPLRTVLGHLTSSTAALRLRLAPLSEEAVQVLVGHRLIDAADLHRRTGGNPFFVTEILSNSDTELPITVRDAVLGRLARLSPSALAVVDAAAVVGPRVDPWLLAAMLPAAHQAADECLASGILVAQGDGLAFRHELARQTALDAMAEVRLVRLHRLALDALQRSPTGRSDLTRLAHHAHGAGDSSAILTYAPAAARQASAAGAHRVAAALLALAVSCPATLPPADAASLLEAHAQECYLIADMPGAIASRRKAAELWDEAGNPLKKGETLALLVSPLTSAGRRDEARQVCQAAIDLLIALPPGRELALAYSAAALLHQYNHDISDAIAHAERAISLAEAAGDIRIQAVAYDTLGLASLYLDYERGCRYLEHARDIAHRDSTRMSREPTGILALSRSCSSTSSGPSATSLTGSTTPQRATWIEPASTCSGGWLLLTFFAVAGPRPPLPLLKSCAGRPSPVMLGWPHWSRSVACRRGVATAPSSPPLDMALELIGTSNELQVVGPVRVARAEAAWLPGDPATTLAEAEAAYATALHKQHHWLAGELAFWRWRAGAADTPPDWIADPFALHIAGDWRASTEAWTRLGCPYEAARALADGDAQAQERALTVFDGLGARPAAAGLRRTMRARGIAHLPRGPRPTTRANRYGLTTRQLEILGLLAQGFTNAEIGARLSIAPKTAEHHVAAVLAKLEVSSRQAAVSLARGQRLVGQDSSLAPPI